MAAQIKRVPKSNNTTSQKKKRFNLSNCYFVVYKVKHIIYLYI